MDAGITGDCIGITVAAQPQRPGGLLMRRVAVALMLLAISAGPLAAQTLTTKEIVELSKAGMSEGVLLALIEVHRSVFPIDRDTLRMLKAEGVSDNVVVAMIRSGRDPIPVPPPPPPAPTPSVIVDRGDGTPELIIKDRDPEQTRVVVVEDREEEPVRERRRTEEYVREVPVAVPVYVTAPARRNIDRRRVDSELPDRVQPTKRQEPVYWGFGGKLRPDAWKPAEPAKTAETPKKVETPKKDR
jgi:hypothetical protein